MRHWHACDAPERPLQLPRHLSEWQDHRHPAEVLLGQRRELPRDAVLHALVHRPRQARLRRDRAILPPRADPGAHRADAGALGHLRRLGARHRGVVRNVRGALHPERPAHPAVPGWGRDHRQWLWQPPPAAQARQAHRAGQGSDEEGGRGVPVREHEGPRRRPLVLRRLRHDLGQRQPRCAGLAVPGLGRGGGHRGHGQSVGRARRARVLHRAVLPGVLRADGAPGGDQLPLVRPEPFGAGAVALHRAEDPQPDGGDRIRPLGVAVGLPAPVRHARVFPPALRGRGLVVHRDARRHHVPARRGGVAVGHGAEQDADAERHPQDHEAARLHAQGRQGLVQQALRHVLHGLAVQRPGDPQPRPPARRRDRCGAHVHPHRRHLLLAQGHVLEDRVPHRVGPEGAAEDGPEDARRDVDGEHRPAEHPGAVQDGHVLLPCPADALGD
mmetsp:Transcript_22212/g.66481  ORF Transcript_22212/g.66481 Transcript_22212/m.66481 type:complete len:442 (-) Transcript_22212:628-1953(-)